MYFGCHASPCVFALAFGIMLHALVSWVSEFVCWASELAHLFLAMHLDLPLVVIMSRPPFGVFGLGILGVWTCISCVNICILHQCTFEEVLALQGRFLVSVSSEFTFKEIYHQRSHFEI